MVDIKLIVNKVFPIDNLKFLPKNLLCLFFIDLLLGFLRANFQSVLVSKVTYLILSYRFWWSLHALPQDIRTLSFILVIKHLIHGFLADCQFPILQLWSCKILELKLSDCCLFMISMHWYPCKSIKSICFILLMKNRI